MSKKYLHSELIEWVKNLDKYCERNDITRHQIVDILTDKGLKELQEHKDSEQFLEFVNIFGGPLTYTISGFAG